MTFAAMLVSSKKKKSKNYNKNIKPDMGIFAEVVSARIPQ